MQVKVVPNMIKVLLIDDDYRHHRILRVLLKEYTLISASTGKEGIDKIKNDDPDIILLDIKLPDINGIEILKKITSKPLSPPVIMLSGFSNPDIVVESIRTGAVDFVEKPYTTEKISWSLHNAVSSCIESAAEPSPYFCPEMEVLVGVSPAISRVKRLITLFAPSDLPVLITGESGTGKELVAKLIHTFSNRRNGPFQARNCAAIPVSLIESEFFGSEQGAYTDAVKRQGCFELAHGGTLFLDEIGEMHISAQVKILRAIEDKEIVKVGGTRKISVDIRIISATNLNITEAAPSDGFRRDLYYRINTLPIYIPSLRERKEDILFLVHHFLERKGRKVCVHDAAMRKLVDHDWPGNIRELRNVVERALLLSNGEKIEPGHIFFN
jgi:two-component system nitrogen regulation response regulator NtrX